MYALVFLALLPAADVAPPANAGLKPVEIDGLSWHADLAAALAEAEKAKSLVFIDCTGVTCINCKINEKDVFSKDEVKAAFKPFVRVQLYSDEIPAKFYGKAPDDDVREDHAAINRRFQKAVFKTEQLPLYAVVKPLGDGKFDVVGTYNEGKINHIDKFIEFLKNSK